MKKLLLIDGILDVKETSLLGNELNNRKFEVVINSVEDGIIVIDEFQNIKAFNNVILKIFGVSQDAVLNNNIDVLDEFCPSVIRELKKNGSFSNFSFTTRNRRKHKGVYFVIKIFLR